MTPLMPAGKLAYHARSMSEAAGSESPAEFTLRAVVTGIVLGIVFGAANERSDRLRCSTATGE